MNWFSIGKVSAKIKRAFNFSDLTPLGSTFKHRWCYKFKHEFRHTGVLNNFSEVLSQSCTWVHIIDPDPTQPHTTKNNQPVAKNKLIHIITIDSIIIIIITTLSPTTVQSARAPNE